VPFDRETTCEDFARRFDGFLDGEMDSHSMRVMSLHASRCPTCGGDLERAEKLQGLLVRHVESEVDRLDTSGLWNAIEARLEPRRGALRERLREYLAERRWFAPLPALTLGGALAALLAALMWPLGAPSGPALVADNHAQIQSIDSNAPHVAVWSEPTEHTTAIWVASYEPEGAP
jgi:anti-sigma factor RsiW